MDAFGDILRWIPGFFRRERLQNPETHPVALHLYPSNRLKARSGRCCVVPGGPVGPGRGSTLLPATLDPLPDAHRVAGDDTDTIWHI